MPEGVSKQRVKTFLENEPEITKKIKETMINDDRWTDFRGEICSLIEKFSKNPTYETKKELMDVVLKFSRIPMECRDAISEIFKGLGISEEVVVRDVTTPEKTNSARRSRSDSREIFDKLGIPYPEDIVKQGEDEIKKKEDAKYGITRAHRDEQTEAPKERRSPSKPRENSEKREKTRTIKAPQVNREEKPKVKKQGKIRSAIVKAAKKAYYKITASVIMAPGTVPPETLRENEELLSRANSKLSELIEELSATSLLERNNSDKMMVPVKLPSGFKSQYAMMRDDKMIEEEIAGFEDDLSKDADKRIRKMRAVFTYLKEGKIRGELRQLLETDFEISEDEIDEQVENLLSKTRVDEDGVLCLPKKSAFNELFFDEEGKVRPEKRELVKKLSTYARSPKVSELSDTEIIKLAKNCRALNEIDSTTREGKLAKFLYDHTEFIPDDVEDRLDDLEVYFSEYEILNQAYQETKMKHKLVLAMGIKEQFGKIYEIIGRVDKKEQENGELDKKDSNSREVALKIARKKVKALEKAGLFKIISDGDKKMRAIAREARGILLPELENAHEKGTKRLNQEYSKQVGETEDEPDKE